MNLTKLLFIGLHVVLAFVIYYFPVSAKIYSIFITLWVFFTVFTAQKKDSYIFLMAYVVGSEVLTRMSGGLFFHETHKYLIMVLALGYIFRFGIKKTAWIFIIYLLLLMPGIIYSMILEANTPSFLIENIRKNILFNISGPLALGLTAIALVREKRSLDFFRKLNFHMMLPVITMTFYMILKTPSLKEIIFTTSSNFALSGGYGPNQVATLLGLGMFSAFVLLLTDRNLVMRTVYLGIFSLFAYRGLLTFSRGGMITAVVMIIVFILVSWQSDFLFLKTKSMIGIGIAALILSVTFYIAVEITHGMLWNRYTGKTVAGVQKSDVTSGRITIFEAEIKGFTDHPIMGMGVGRAKIERKEKLGITIATHNEISRLLSEHGIFGLLALFILLLAPFLTGALKKNNLFFFPFFIFWFFTIFHSSMRISAPAALYGFSLIILNLQNKNE
jgi:O-antigen ligase